MLDSVIYRIFFLILKLTQFKVKEPLKVELSILLIFTFFTQLIHSYHTVLLILTVTFYLDLLSSLILGKLKFEKKMKDFVFNIDSKCQVRNTELF